MSENQEPIVETVESQEPKQSKPAKFIKLTYLGSGGKSKYAIVDKDSYNTIDTSDDRVYTSNNEVVVYAGIKKIIKGTMHRMRTRLQRVK